MDGADVLHTLRESDVHFRDSARITPPATPSPGLRLQLQHGSRRIVTMVYVTLHYCSPEKWRILKP